VSIARLPIYKSIQVEVVIQREGEVAFLVVVEEDI